MPAPVPPYQRLLSGYTEDPQTGCWNWRGQTYRNGYGCLKAFGKTVSAHRFSYELHKGPIESGMEVLHSCDNKLCINPDHLRVGSHAENMSEAAARGLMRRGEHHPKYGKPSPRRGINSNQSKPVRVLGRVFGSLNEAERELGLGSGTVAYWLRAHPAKAQPITRKEFFDAE